MQNKLLTIAIPTYRRLHHLKRLLNFLCDEVQGQDGSVEIFVSDNKSDDGTEEYLKELSRKFSFLIFSVNDQNVGPDENFRLCFIHSKSKFFWLLGDDDYPQKGFVNHLVGLLKKSSEIDMLYLDSKWVNNIEHEKKDELTSLKYIHMKRGVFAEAVNIWMGYISGIIIRKDLVTEDQTELLVSLNGTSLLQFGWVLPVLKGGKNFYFIKNKCILATRNNTGGYAGIEVFGNNLIKIIQSYLEADVRLQRKIISPMVLNFFTALVWKIEHQKDQGVFLKEKRWDVVCSNFKEIFVFQLFTRPAHFLPKSLGLLFVVAAKILGMLWRKLLLWVGYELI